MTALTSKLALARLVLPALAVATAQACGNSCFGGNTWISVERGRKRLRDVKVGDLVKTFDVRTGELTLRPVTRVFSHGPKPVGQLMSRTGAGPGGVTGNHPIFVEDLGDFAAAEDFQRGGQMQRGLYWDDRDLRAIELEPYRRGPNGHLLPVHNLSIAETETYFADGLLVHNKSTPCDPTVPGCVVVGSGGSGSGGSGSGGAPLGSGGSPIGSGGQVGSGGTPSGGSAGAAGSAGEGGAAGGAP